jgi:hypothetical protein
MAFNCEFCKKDFSSKSSLNKHKTSTKKCILIQNKINNEIKKEHNNLWCQYCNKIFTSKQNFNIHDSTCYSKIKIKDIEIKYENMLKSNKDYKIKLLEEKIKNEIQEKNKLKDEILKLKTELKIKDKIYKDEHECLKEIAKQPKHISSHNNKIVNIETPFDFNNIELAKQIIDEKYSINYILDGQKGMADFAVENMLKD